MRTLLWLVATLGGAVLWGSTCFAQVDLSAVAVPPEPHELAARDIDIKTLSTPKEIADAFELIDRARLNIGIYQNVDAGFHLKVSFTASGMVANTGPGSMEEIRRARGQERWSAQIGNYSMLRINSDRVMYDEKPAGPVPIRIHMLRNALFWPVSYPEAMQRVRTFNARWDGKRVTCVLMSPRTAMAPVEPSGRGWREREYCIDPRATLMEIYSEAPGIYVVYDYRDAAKLGGNTLPRQFSIFQNGAAVLNAHVDLLEDAGALSPDVFTPSSKAVSNGAVLRQPTHYFRDPSHKMIGIVIRADVSKVEPILVHATTGSDGKTYETELLQNVNPSIAQAALQQVRAMSWIFPGAPQGGIRQDDQYIEVDVVPLSTPLLGCAEANSFNGPPCGPAEKPR